MSPRINHTKSTNPAGFPFISTNVRCLFNKVEELRAIAEGSSAHHPVFIAVQETWADCADSDAMYDINNYNLYRADRKQNFGGGVCLYISATLQQSRLGIQLESAESVWMKITMGNYNVIVSSIYRPPRSDPNKELANEIAPSLAHIFNLSFQSGEIPQDWRDATITPIHKKGPKTSPTNYRPISLLSITSKVQERIVHDRLYKHISPHLPSQQSGFRKMTTPNSNLLGWFTNYRKDVMLVTP